MLMLQQAARRDAACSSKDRARWPVPRPLHGPFSLPVVAEGAGRASGWLVSSQPPGDLPVPPSALEHAAPRVPAQGMRRAPAGADAFPDESCAQSCREEGAQSRKQPPPPR
ncbi:hypothetical protein FA09DRAFT_330348 [Tilletiopsis washingtonensis]|uniref:Uncharacterized protein n=1 Tax=Tilletiopsis washingtonensis TaxID=58919 RepID=A0A316Z7E6_9BASI|nr:hypothetical protein FA09DRAFT_330348 [Tilletiopsis washingtonensis]PWN97690.1 hypothetical protein FA09DRAFT_330348 [Tilletiopsis washingtonensis]